MKKIKNIVQIVDIFLNVDMDNLNLTFDTYTLK